MPKFLEVTIRIPIRESVQLTDDEIYDSLFASADNLKGGVTVYSDHEEDILVDTLGHIVHAEVINE